MMVGSEGTLGVVLEAKLNLVPLPKAKAVLAIQFQDTLEALAATPVILQHRPSAVEIMDEFILDHTKQSPALERIRSSFVQGDPGALLCVEFYDETPDEPAAADGGAWSRTFAAAASATHFHRAIELSDQARIWSLREAALGLSMAMKEEAKSISFVEDTAVVAGTPARLHRPLSRHHSKARNNRRHLRSRLRRMSARPAGRQSQNRAGHPQVRSDRE